MACRTVRFGARIGGDRFAGHHHDDVGGHVLGLEHQLDFRTPVVEGVL